jgi:hypothetical protein
MKTTTISLRVPLDFKNELQSICKTKGVTLSDYCLTHLTPSGEIPSVNAQVIHKLTKGGNVGKVSLPSKLDVPQELISLLSATGGFVIGAIVYKSLKHNLTVNNPEWTDDKIQGIALAAAVTGGLLAGITLNELGKKISK